MDRKRKAPSRSNQRRSSAVSAKRASAGGLSRGVVVEPPNASRGLRYAWIPIQAFRDLSAGALKFFAFLSSQPHPGSPSALSAAECAASLGCCERSLRYWRRELEREGWVEPGRLTIRRSRRVGKGYRARVDVRRLSVMSPASLRAYVAVMFATRDGVRQQTYEVIARTLGRSRQTLWAALKGVRAELPPGRAAACRPKATELLREVLAKTDTEEGRQELRVERERQRNEAGRAEAARDATEAVMSGPAGVSAEGCVLCVRYRARTPDGLCESCDPGGAAGTAATAAGPPVTRLLGAGPQE